MALTADLGSVNRTPTPPTSGGGPCPPGIVGGVSILRFGKSLPLVELFETFMITGFVLVAVASSTYYTFSKISELLKTEGSPPSTVNLASSAAAAQPVWIAVGVVIFVIGVLLYYFHRRVLGTPS